MSEPSQNRYSYSQWDLIQANKLGFWRGWAVCLVVVTAVQVVWILLRDAKW